MGSSTSTISAPWALYSSITLEMASATSGSKLSVNQARGTPILIPLTPLYKSRAKSSVGTFSLVESHGSKPTMSPKTQAMSSTVCAIKPAVSKLEANAIMPKRLGRPYVGLTPVIPQKLAGSRIDPPVSVAVAIGASPAAIQLAEPPELPPGTALESQGLKTLP